MDDLSGRAAVVTGAANGIGFAIADALAGAGARVLVTDVDPAGAQRAADRIRASGGTAEALALDVRDPAAVERAADHAVRQFGALHIAVNNAGIVNGGPSWELPLEEWHRVVDVNFWGVIHGIRAFVPRILESGEGHVVNISSMAAVVPHPGVAPYTASKYAVLGATEVLRGELDAAGSAVGVSVVLPGMIRTDMNPVGSNDPSLVAAKVLDAIRTRRLYVFTDDYATDLFEARLALVLAEHRAVVGETVDQAPTSS
jgi:NAD(P)-dependent dehydrogenase (short-subunit alcohol dehydrogenase family)